MPGTVRRWNYPPPLCIGKNTFFSFIRFYVLPSFCSISTSCYILTIPNIAQSISGQGPSLKTGKRVKIFSSSSKFDYNITTNCWWQTQDLDRRNVALESYQKMKKLGDVNNLAKVILLFCLWELWHYYFRSWVHTLNDLKSSHLWDCLTKKQVLLIGTTYHRLSSSISDCDWLK